MRFDSASFELVEHILIQVELFVGGIDLVEFRWRIVLPGAWMYTAEWRRISLDLNQAWTIALESYIN